jgi:hypothetical protein
MISKNLFEEMTQLFASKGWHLRSMNVHNSQYGTYEMTVDAIMFKNPKTNQVHFPANSGVRLPNIDPDPVCECGAAAAKTTHSSWCPLTAAAKP